MNWKAPTGVGVMWSAGDKRHSSVPDDGERMLFPCIVVKKDVATGRLAHPFTRVRHYTVGWIWWVWCAAGHISIMQWENDDKLMSDNQQIIAIRQEAEDVSTPEIHAE